MGKKATLSPIVDKDNNATELNTSLNAINDKLENTLSLDGSTPNAMNADLDMNSNDILNIKDLNATKIFIDGVRATPTDLVSVDVDVILPTYDTPADLVSAIELVDNDYVFQPPYRYLVKPAGTAGAHVTTATKTAFEVGPVFSSYANMSASNLLGYLDNYSDGTVFRVGNLTWSKSSGATGIPDLLDMVPDGDVLVQHFGADKTGVTDSLASFQACIEYMGNYGKFKAEAGSYDLSAPLELTKDGQKLDLLGCVFNNSIIRARPAINILGKPLIDPEEFGSRNPFFGFLDVYGQDGSDLNVEVFNVGGPAYTSGNTYRGQVAKSNITIYSEDCGMVACHAHGEGGIVGFSRAETPSTLSTLTSGGTGYDDGRWIAPLTGGTGSGALVAFDVVSGVVTSFYVIQGGKDYVTGDVLSFTNSTAINDAQAVMSAGSGFSLTVGDVQETGPSATSWYNENETDYGANGGWYGGVSSFGRYNYNGLKTYIEAVWTRGDSPITVDEGIDNIFSKLEVLVNANVGETTTRTTDLVSMPNAFGTVVLGGRSGNPFSTATDPYTLFDFGGRSTFAFDAFSDVASTRGNPYRSFTPTVESSTGLADFTPTYTAQYGKFKDEGGSVTFELTVIFDTNAYTGSMSVMEIDISDMYTLLNDQPNTDLTAWPLNLMAAKGFTLDSSNPRLYTEIIAGVADVIRVYSDLGGTDNAIGQGEITASQTGYTVSLSGRFEY